MPDFVLTYRSRKGHTPSADTTTAWYAWFDGMGDQLVEMGRPVLDRASIGESNPEHTELGGYSIVRAEDIHRALAIAKGCPGLDSGGGVEVGLLGQVHDRAQQSS
jgi:hypothetical protein